MTKQNMCTFLGKTRYLQLTPKPIVSNVETFHWFTTRNVSSFFCVSTSFHHKMNDVTYILYYCATYKISASNLFWLLTLHPEIHVAFPNRCPRSTSMNQNGRHTAVPWSDCKPLARNLILTHWWRLFNWECPSPTPPNQKHKKDKMLVENSHLCLEFEI